ncbi:MAG: carboxymuconolactone decarboxylase family protein [Deltaproteobacteria bacterium]|jgi:alkylhydroperoxidase/carboxymuconolactone decarboxylase family protein YurZ/quercetin dioxygenase-like cupin family protein|nr:carboxymuconolactone decarboxylase family protein [Deltaproteobacteria bacterium]
MSEKVKAGREALGDFAPAFARINDDVLFGEVWSREKQLSPKNRSMITVAALMTGGVFDSSFEFHLKKAKENGIAKEEIAEILTHLSFYAGWPKAWAAFRLAKEIWTDQDETEANEKAGANKGAFGDEIGKGAIFPLGEPNDAYAKYFTGQSYLKMLSTEGVLVAHVSFAPSCRNWWHVHHKGGQILLATGGRGYYQEFGEKAQELRPGDAVNVKAEVKHWHGAAAHCWFSHLAIEVPAIGASNEWVEPVTDGEYKKLS